MRFRDFVRAPSPLRLACAAAAVVSLTLPVALAAQTAPRGAASPFGQKLVASVSAHHADVTEVGIELPTARGCTTVASTDPGDVGEKCESDDIAPLRTGRPAVAREADGYDVSVLLHDASGRQVGVVGIEMKLAGHTRRTALAEAERIEREMAARIPSKASLSVH